jgi:outer membrane protein assembly factor BamB
MVLVMQPGAQPVRFRFSITVGIPVVVIAHTEMAALRAAVSAGTEVVVTIRDEEQEGVVRAYNATSGALVWQDQFGRGGLGSQQARTFAIKAGRLYVGGATTTATADEVAVRAYDSRTGVLWWEHYTPGTPTSLSLFTYARGVVVQGDRVFVGSSVATEVGVEFVVQAHDAQTGMLRWEDKANEGDVNFLDRIAVHGDRVFGFGFGGYCPNAPSPPSNCDTLVRSYDTTTGKLLWKRHFDASRLDDFPSGIVVDHGTVFLASVAGQVSSDGGKWWIQALDASSGDTRWESTGGDLELPLGLTVYRGRLFVPGRSVDAATNNWDFIVRVYDARPGP